MVRGLIDIHLSQELCKNNKPRIVVTYIFIYQKQETEQNRKPDDFYD